MRAIWDRYTATGEFSDYLDPDVEIYDHDIPESGAYRGVEGFARWVEEAAGQWADYEAVPREFIDAGERVVVLLEFTATGAGSGIRLSREDAIVYELRDGLIVRFDYFNNRATALAFAGVGA